MILFLEAFGYLIVCALLINFLNLVHRFGKLKKVKPKHVWYTVTTLLAVILCVQVLINNYLHKHMSLQQTCTYWTTADGYVTMEVRPEEPGYIGNSLQILYDGECRIGFMDFTSDYSLYAYMNVLLPNGEYESLAYNFFMPNDHTLILNPAIGNDSGERIVLERVD